MQKMPNNLHRDIKISRALLEGRTLKSVGDEHSLSMERVRSIYCKMIRRGKRTPGFKDREITKSYNFLSVARPDADFVIEMVNAVADMWNVPRE